jgi:hypothetical protein
MILRVVPPGPVNETVGRCQYRFIVHVIINAVMSAVATGFPDDAWCRVACAIVMYHGRRNYLIPEFILGVIDGIFMIVNAVDPLSAIIRRMKEGSNLLLKRSGWTS